MSQAFSFAIAGNDAITEINQLVNKAYRGTTSKKGWTTEAHFLDGIRTDEEQLQLMINDPDSVILTCRQEHQLIGCVFLQKQKSKMYLGMLTVDPELQDKGLGKLLLKKAEEHAVDKGCDTIMITVITKRLELIDWYKRRGYTETGEVKPFPDDPKFGLPKEPLSFCVMEKQIDML